MSGGDPLATCRNIPLDRVAAAIGYRRDPADRARFRREGSVSGPIEIVVMLPFSGDGW